MRMTLECESIESRLCMTALPSGFTETTLATGLLNPIGMVQLPDSRLLVTQRNGAIRVLKTSGLVGAPALQLSVDSTRERGLLGIDIDPQFSTNHFVYVQYVPKSTATPSAQVSRFTMSGDTISPASEKVLLQIDPQVASAEHVAGAVHFGTDGKLYIVTGDNGVPADSQSMTTLHGKMLRINADGSIPSDNPFFNTNTGIYRAIYATGLRNPFTFAVNKVTGKMYINDVGDKSFEEIDLARAGANFGWPGSEGPTSDPAFDTPVYAYPPAAGQGAAIIGGAFYSGITQQFPTPYAGSYFYGDYVEQFIRVFNPTTNSVTDFATGAGKIVDITAISDGSLFSLTTDGVLHAYRYKAPTPATASITGYVVNDLNANGVWNSGEVGITGRSVWLDLNNNGLFDAGEPTQTSGANGKFTFSGLAAGTYKIREVIPTGWQQTGPANNFGLTVTLATGQVRSGVSFQVAKV